MNFKYLDGLRLTAITEIRQRWRRMDRGVVIRIVCPISVAINIALVMYMSFPLSIQSFNHPITQSFNHLAYTGPPGQEANQIAEKATAKILPPRTDHTHKVLNTMGRFKKMQLGLSQKKMNQISQNEKRAQFISKKIVSHLLDSGLQKIEESQRKARIRDFNKDSKSFEHFDVFDAKYQPEPIVVFDNGYDEDEGQSDATLNPLDDYTVAEQSRYHQEALTASGDNEHHSDHSIIQSVDQSKYIPKFQDCSQIYFDFGSNIGVQTRKIFEPNLYPTAGILKHYNETFGDFMVRRESVCSFGFEANPLHQERLEEVQNCYLQKGWNTDFEIRAVGNSDNENVSFWSDPNSKHEDWGAGLSKFGAHTKEYHVLTMDIGKFVKETIDY